MMKNNSPLVLLEMRDNKISGEAVQHLVQAIQHNNTLQELVLPRYTEDIEKRIRSLKEEFNKDRKDQKNCTLIISSYFSFDL